MPAIPTLTSIQPQLFVADIRLSCDFYTQKLGFTLAFVYGDPPFYAQVQRDYARLNLRMVDEPVFASDIRTREHLLSATITLATATGLNQLFQTYQTANVPIHQPLRQEPWGATTFILADPDNNLILFVGPEAD